MNALALLLVAATQEPSALAVVAAKDAVVVPVGETVLVDVSILVSRPRFVAVPKREAVTVLIRGQQSDRHTTVWPWIEVVDVTKKSIRMLVPIRGLEVGSGPVTFGAEVYELGAGDAVGGRPLSFQVEVVAEAGSEEAIEARLAAWERHQTIAKQMFDKLDEKTQAKLHLDRFEAPPRAPQVPETDAATLTQFLHHRLRAEAARSRLRAMADDPSAEVAKKAALAVVSLYGPPEGETKEAKALERVSNAKAIAMTQAALEDLRIDEAHGNADKLLESGRLDPSELATVLALRGLVRVLRKEQTKGERLLGQAFCLEQELDLGVKRPYLVEIVEAAKAANTCTTPLALGTLTATRIGTDNGRVIEVIAEFGPDPHQLVRRANIQLWSYEGTLETARTVEADHTGHARIQTQLSDAEPDREGHVLLKIFLRDANGIEVLVAGEPDPIAVPLVIGDGGGFEIPGWLWIVAGGVVVVGAASAGVVLLSKDREIERVIGPVDVRF